jgi:hypothetical protein
MRTSCRQTISVVSGRIAPTTTKAAREPTSATIPVAATEPIAIAPIARPQTIPSTRVRTSSGMTR